MEKKLNMWDDKPTNFRWKRCGEERRLIMIEEKKIEEKKEGNGNMNRINDR